MDRAEGNIQAENASSLVGMSFGSVGDPLCLNVQTLTPAGSGFAGGNSNFYNNNNSLADDQFSINGGPVQTYDTAVVYSATITYTNGETATITAVVAQDTDGNTYLMPEMSPNADVDAMEAAPIRSLTLDRLLADSFDGLAASREITNFMVCFAEGTRIMTEKGERPVEKLGVGDLVQTLDNGLQPIRWISGREVDARGAMTPIRICKGALGPKVPKRDLVVSRQHRILAQSRIAARMFNVPQVLIAAAKLSALPGVREVSGRDKVTYWHFLCDHHEIVIANGAPAETLYLGPQAMDRLGQDQVDEIVEVFPELANDFVHEMTRKIPPVQKQNQLVKRAKQNGIPLLEGWIPPALPGALSQPR